MLTIAARFIAALFHSRQTAVSGVLWSLGLHFTAFAVTYAFALWPNPIASPPSKIVFEGNRYAIEFEAAFSEAPTEPEIETVLELEPPSPPTEKLELPLLESALTVAPPSLHWPPHQQAIRSPQPETKAPAPEIVEQFAGNEEAIPPDLTGNRPPRYPAEAIRRHLEGVVLLRVHIGTSGRVERVEIAKSSGHAILDRRAVEAVRTWHARPAKREDSPVATVEILPIYFRL